MKTSLLWWVVFCIFLVFLAMLTLRLHGQQTVTAAERSQYRGLPHPFSFPQIYHFVGHKSEWGVVD